jgi:4-amino-4-deoxy-L-arabinose transferase-like glycosyltransferase
MNYELTVVLNKIAPQNNMKNISKLLTAILIIAGLFRLPYLNTHMPSLYGDEIAIGYNALSIVKTGRDEFGRFMPLQFESWGDQKNPVYIYAVAFVQLLTGPTPASVRLPSALAGIVAVYLTYRLVMLLKLGEGVALFSALILSLTPWHIHISRGGYEANLALTLGLASVVYLLQKKNILSVLMLVLSTYTYYTSKIFTPALLLLTWTWMVQGQKSKIWLKSFIKYWILAFILAIPIIYLALFADGQARFKAINIFADKTVALRVIRNRNFFEDAKSLTAKLLENRATYHYQDFFTYYFDNFSGQFLFVGGDSNVRYGLGNHGMLYVIDAPFILAGIIMLYSKNRKVWLFLFAWLLLAPLPTALVGRAYGLRSLVMLPILQIFAGYSLYQVYLWSKQSKLNVLLYTTCCLLYAGSVSIWTTRYIYQYPSYGKYWYDGTMHEALEFAKEREDKYDQIIITQSYGEESMYYAFYNQIDPRVYRQAKDNKLTIDGVPMIKIGKYYFGDIRPKGPIEQMDLPSNTLLIVQPLFEYGEEDILARDDGRVIFRTFGFPTVHMKLKQGVAP